MGVLDGESVTNASIKCFPCCSKATASLGSWTVNPCSALGATPALTKSGRLSEAKTVATGFRSTVMRTITGGSPPPCMPVSKAQPYTVPDVEVNVTTSKLERTPTTWALRGR
eukprot:TRINITY_DN12170_c0_g1_i1.p4 TRINITY_DN12170_c0_g1~~TRINITY_DN12170_c0_g1_i1.p4  ORF type:complete len:112 (-),score=15.81 TRINITY_DN12170_c0_g1_i1:1627-1962(-)